MSRIGKLPVAIPGGVTATLTDTALTVKGPKGELSMAFVNEVNVEQGEDGIVIKPRDETKKSRAMWGMQRALVANLVQGVSAGYEKNLELVGVGYRAQMQGTSLKLSLGLSHDVIYDAPEGITIAVGKPTLRRWLYNSARCGRCDGPVRSWQIQSRTCYACARCQPLDGAAVVPVDAAAPALFNSHCASESLEERLAQPQKLRVAELRATLEAARQRYQASHLRRVAFRRIAVPLFGRLEW